MPGIQFPPIRIREKTHLRTTYFRELTDIQIACILILFFFPGKSRFDSKRHLRQFESASSLPSPALRLGVRVCSARGLPAKDALAGTSHPFATVSLDGREAHSTAVRPGTTEPDWEAGGDGGAEAEVQLESAVGKRGQQGMGRLRVDVWSLASGTNVFHRETECS